MPASARIREMDWMAAKAARADPQALWPQARSIVMLGLNYQPLATTRNPSSTVIALTHRSTVFLTCRGSVVLVLAREGAPVMGLPAQQPSGWPGCR